MQIKRKKGIDGKLDIVWSKLVKARAGNKCEYCGAMNKQIHSHHIYSRSKKSVRWDVLNGVSLCAGHHVLSSKFSAHKTPTEFTEWLIKKKGHDFMDRLRLRAHQTSKLHKFEKEILYQELEKQLKEWK